MKTFTTLAALTLTATTAFAGSHAAPMVDASDQDVSNGVVSADNVTAGENGWLVVHRTGSDMKPGRSSVMRPSARAPLPMWPPS